MAAISEGSVTQSVSVTVSTSTLAGSGVATVSAISNLSGQKQSNQEGVARAAGAYQKILAVIPGATIQDRFASEIAEARYFRSFFDRVSTLIQQPFTANLVRHGISVDETGLGQFLTFMEQQNGSPIPKTAA